MDIKVAQAHAKKINEARDVLNAAIAHAALDNVHTELEIFEVTTIGMRYYPTVKANVTVNPEELEC